MGAYRPRLKICGVACAEDARLVGGCGADYCGILVGVNFSERNLSLEEACRVAEASRAPVVVLLCEPGLDAALAACAPLAPPWDGECAFLVSDAAELVGERARAACARAATLEFECLAHAADRPQRRQPELRG